MPESVDPTRLRLTNEEGSQGALLGLRCRDCTITIFGPGTFCQQCTSPNLESVELSQEGTLYSYTVVRVPPAGWPGPIPYILGQVELSEGPQVLAEIIDCQEEELTIGMPMHLALCTVSGQEGQGRQSSVQVGNWERRSKLTQIPSATTGNGSRSRFASIRQVS